MGFYSKKIFTVIILIGLATTSFCQDTLKLSLNQVINLAQDQSLDAFINENMYLSSWWEYRAFKAQKRPWLVLGSTPVHYNNSIEVLTDTAGSYFNHKDEFASSGALSLTQNIMTTGGNISVYSDLNRIKNYSTNTEKFGSTPVSINISQPLFQHNPFKWQKKIEPLKFEIAKKDYIKSAEEIAIKSINYFFNFMDAQQAFKIAELNKISADSLYYKSMGLYDRGAIAYMDLQRLELNMLNTETTYEKSKLQLERNKFDLKSYLRIPEDQDLELIVPDSISDLKIIPQEALNLALENNPDMLTYQQILIEADRDIAKAKGDNGINSSLNFDFGLSKSSNTIQNVYRDFDRSQIIELSLYIPIVDWGMSRGQKKIAQSNKKVKVAMVEMEQISFKEDVLMSAKEFNTLESQLANAKKANAISEKTYKTVEERFLLGKVNLETLYAARNERDNALRSYYNRIRQYWGYYYYMRSLTLYDFENGQSLSKNFDEFFGL